MLEKAQNLRNAMKHLIKVENLSTRGYSEELLQIHRYEILQNLPAGVKKYELNRTLAANHAE